MRIKSIVLGVLALVLLLTGILSGCGGAKTGTYTPSASWCQSIADQIKAIQPVDIPGTLAQEGGLKTDNEFDVNDYFPIFTHLSINKGYVLDYLYIVSGPGGAPMLYTRQVEVAPYLGYEEFLQDTTNVTLPENDVTLVYMSKSKNNEVNYGNQISIDNSPESYYEYSVLQLLGGQFYLFYKATQYDIRVVCQPDKVEQILGEIDGSDMTPINEDFKAAARALDLQPVVEIGVDTATVSLVIFTKWGGFSRVYFTISHDYPHIINKYVNENILAYNCGITL
jgi:hypothetical protein